MLLGRAEAALQWLPLLPQPLWVGFFQFGGESSTKLRVVSPFGPLPLPGASTLSHRF